jgi:hypothetical protein
MTTLYLRNVPEDVAQRVKRAAQIRGMTLATYLAQLSDLHRSMLDLTENGMTCAIPNLLAMSGLGPVKE